MNRFRPAVGERASALAAAMASIVLTVLTLLSTAFRIHADQMEWAAAVPPTTAGPTEESAGDHGGASAWV